MDGAASVWRTGGSGATGPLIHQLFEQQSNSAPSSLALRTGNESVTYAELDRRADKFAHHLRSRGAEAGSVVGLCLPRGTSLIVGLLGVLKAGAAYLPLDPAAPPLRSAELLASTSARLIVTNTPANVYEERGHEVVLPDADPRAATVPQRPAATRSRRVARPNDIAYVIPTSGSTGQPKLVAVSHRGLVQHAYAMRDLCELGPRDRVLQFHNITFDAAAEELYPTWLAGAQVITLIDGSMTAPSGLNKLIRECDISVLNLPTSYWHQWSADLLANGTQVSRSLRLVVIGGETADSRLTATWLDKVGVPLLNTYGITETTISSTAHMMRHHREGAPVPIGRPIPGTTCHVLDAHMNTVTNGQRGELYIGGDGVSLGYLGNPVLTADRFVPDVFATDSPGTRLYRSGDIVTMRPDGILEFHGRADCQIKVRGFRIEPGEVEAVLVAHPRIVGACVCASRDRDERLVAYVVPQGHSPRPTPAELRDHLAMRLPNHLIPQLFVSLNALPLTQNGKVDRKALEVYDRRNAVTGLRPPETLGVDGSPLAHEVTRIWEDVLGCGPLTARADFFAHGGHSLLAFKIMGRLEARLNIQLPLATIFEHPVMKDFVLVVEKYSRAAAEM